MKRVRLAAALCGATVAVIVGAAGLARAKEQTLKELMGDNFAGLQTILVSLITSNYSAVPDQVKRIEEHAARLTHTVPEVAKHDPKRFVTYAYNLQSHAMDLRSIVELLIEHDKGSAATGTLVTDELREAAAAHYGGMVNMCVSCHNRFRPNAIPR